MVIITFLKKIVKISIVNREELTSEAYQLIKDYDLSFRQYQSGQFPRLPDGDEHSYYPLIIIAIHIQSRTIFHKQILPMMKEVLIAQVSFIELLKSLPDKPNNICIGRSLALYGESS